ncbi:TonB-dependent receptor [Erythrobacter aurantius]|uniref:TonB-dependent receptor n=1 Tax=Erythrobacter aurantius TaxID=2909249 RepID=UPI00207A8D1D|nr:TonB-dependent receptor [Erythrobacter aurantius]
MRLRATLLYTTAIFGAASVAAPSLAQVADDPAVDAEQTDGDERSGGIPTIVVTAQKREQSVQDVPISLQVVTGESLQNMQIAGVEDLAGSLPNVFVTKDTVSSNVYIRGVGSGSNAGFEQAVATFVDGVYHGRSRYTQSAFVDVERVEVLRGPQSIYFGNNAIGGAFSVVTRTPSLSNWEGSIQASYEFEGNEPAVEAGVGGPLIEDKLGIRVAGRYSDLDGFITNGVIGQDNPNVEDKFIRGTMVAEFGDAWQATFKAEYGKQDSIAPLAVQLTNCPPEPPFNAAATFSCGFALATGQETELDYNRSANPGEFGDIEAQEYVFTLEKDNLNGPGIVFQAAISKYDFFLAADTDGVAADFFSFNTFESVNQKTLETRFTSPRDFPVEVIFGGYYLDTGTTINTTLNFPFATVLLAGPLAPLAPFAPLAGDISLDQQEEAMSLFGSVTVPLGETFSVTGGLRYTHSRKQGLQSATNATANDPFGLTVTPLPAALQPVAAFLTGFNTHTTLGIVEDDAFLPSVSVQFEPTDDLTLYAKFSEGFKAGGLDAVELTGIADRLTFEPETVDSYEIGLKAFLFDRNLSFNIAAFRSDYSDLQQSVAQFTATSAFITIANVGGLRTQGIETGLVWQITDNLQFGADVAYLDAAYQDYANAGCTALQALQAQNAGQVGCSQNLTGEAPPFAPSYSGNIRLGYETPIGDSLKLTVDGAMNFSGGYHVIADRDPNTFQSAWEKFDLRVGIGDYDDRWGVAFVGRNLGNTLVVGSANDVVASAGSYTQQVQRGRTLAIQANFKFK